MLRDGLWCAFEDCHMGSEAEHVARKCNLTREDQDRFAAECQRRAATAEASGAFDDEIVPVAIRTRSGEELLRRDEGPRPDTTVEKLAALKPAFEPKGTVTAGNASMLSDGASAVVVTTEKKAKAIDSGIRARIVASATSGIEPKDIFLAPVSAVQKVLARAGLSADDIDLFEINEAFAAQMLACVRGLELDPAKVNVHGGAIALGHPIGASGARVLTTLLYALTHRGLKRGLASLCLGGGNAVAMIVQRD
jgi:acetyl-CoA C-acetyltransferase